MEIRMKGKKKISIIANSILLIWFFLDMIGVAFDNRLLVSRSWQEDGIFFVVFIVAFLCFILKEKIGKHILSSWLFIWFASQVYFHWYFTIFGPWEGKIKYFRDTVKLIPSKIVYIPDLYHIVLHMLILVSLASTMIYSIKTKTKKERG